MKHLSARSLVSAFLALALALPLGAGAARAEGPAVDSRVLRSSDVDATAAWYRDQLGFRLVADRPTVKGRVLVLAHRGALLELAEADQPTVPAPTDVETTASVARLPVSVLVADVDAEVARLKSANVLVLSDPDDDLDGRFRTAHVRDGDGRTVELREPLSGRSGDAS